MFSAVVPPRPLAMNATKNLSALIRNRQPEQYLYPCGIFRELLGRGGRAGIAGHQNLAWAGMRHPCVRREVKVFQETNGWLSRSTSDGIDAALADQGNNVYSDGQTSMVPSESGSAQFL